MAGGSTEPPAVNVPLPSLSHSAPVPPEWAFTMRSRSKSRSASKNSQSSMSWPEIEPGIAECAFGEWDGLTFAEVHERWPEEVRAWLGSTEVAPPGGESFAQCRARVDAGRQRIIEAHPGQRVVLISHVTPIKILTGIAVDAPLHSLYRMELAPCSLSTIAWFPDGVVSLFGFAEQAHLRDVDTGAGV